MSCSELGTRTAGLPPDVRTLREPPRVGETYLVPCVGGRIEDHRAWWPVLGEQHEDREIIRFEKQHWHLDGRFLNEAHLKTLLWAGSVDRARKYGVEALDFVITGRALWQLFGGGVRLLKRRCEREAPTFPCRHVREHHWLGELGNQVRRRAPGAGARLPAPRRRAGELPRSGRLRDLPAPRPALERDDGRPGAQAMKRQRRRNPPVVRTPNLDRWLRERGVPVLEEGMSRAEVERILGPAPTLAEALDRERRAASEAQRFRARVAPGNRG
ncbi:MAG: hypothetical protein M5U26_08275 [Planctomycetota bacterium]|nr:hypothetical protein [Planctomycetota bacterium]